MTIKRVRVYRFGPIFDKIKEFGENIHILWGPGEVERSLLHKFILAMLYGLSRERDITGISEYERFFPAGKEQEYGGTMLIVKDGKEIVIERIFLREGDRVKAYLNKTGEDITKEVFDQGLHISPPLKFLPPRELYEATVFVPELGWSIPLASRGLLLSFLSKKVEGGVAGKVEEAVGELTRELRDVESGPDGLWETEALLEKLETEKDLIMSARERFIGALSREIQLKERLRGVESELKVLRGIAEKAKVLEAESIVDDIKRLKEERRKLLGMLRVDYLREGRFIDLKGREAKLRDRLAQITTDIARINKEIEAVQTSLKALGPLGELTREEISGALEKLREKKTVEEKIKEIRQRIDDVSSELKRAKGEKEKLEKRFSVRKIEKAKGKIKDIYAKLTILGMEEAKRQLDSYREALQRFEKERVRIGSPILAGLGISTVGTFLGIVSGDWRFPLCLGGVSLVLPLVAVGKIVDVEKRRKPIVGFYRNAYGKFKELSKRGKDLQKELIKTLRDCGFENYEEFEAFLQKYGQTVSAATRLEEELKSLRGELKGLEAKRETLETSLRELGKGDPKIIEEISLRGEKAMSLRGRLEELNAKREEFEREKASLEEELRRVSEELQRLVGAGTQQENIGERVLEIERILARKRKDLERYGFANEDEADTRIKLIKAEVGRFKDQLHRIKELEEEYSKINDELAKLRKEPAVKDEAKRLMEIEVVLRRLKSKREKLRARREAILYAISKMRTLKRRLITNPLEVLQDPLRSVLTRVIGREVEDIIVDSNFGVWIKFVDEETVRGEFELPLALRSMCFLALRLLVAKLILDEKMPILLDEPFSPMDDEKTEKFAEWMVEEFAGWQIVLFTSHDREKKLFLERFSALSTAV